MSNEYRPQADRFDSATATIEQLVASMKRNGGVIIRNFMPEDEISAIESEVRPYLEEDLPWEGSAFPPQTRRVTGLLVKSQAFRNYLPSPTLLSVTSTLYWGGMPNQITARPIIGGALVFCVNPGAAAQPLHRDDMQWHRSSPKVTTNEYEIGQDATITLFVAGRKLTKKNGVTRFYPGSHLEQSQTPPNEAKAIYAEMDKGDSLFMLSSCYHGGSASTTVNEERLVYSAFIQASFLRQGENQYVVIGNELAATWDDELLARIGYACSAPALGFVDFKDPMTALKQGQSGRRLNATG
ncbi:phytanoyl-dioxygenase family protein [Phaeosphaeriaceae sp. PMI808]|nr:phytanoyl-dioxygenase family protein [Phaeosphaeriaceae sp. PMI808]